MEPTLNKVNPICIITEEDPDGSEQQYILAWENERNAILFSQMHSSMATMFGGEIRIYPHRKEVLVQYLRDIQKGGPQISIALNPDPYTGAVHRFVETFDFEVEVPNHSNNHTPVSQQPTYSSYQDNSCFSLDSRVLMADNSYKTLQEVNKGDLVMGYNLYKNKFEPTKVLRKNEHSERTLLQIVVNGNVLKSTPNHVFLTTMGAKKGYELLNGDELVSKSNDNNIISGIEYKGSLPVGNLYTDLGSFVVEDQVVYSFSVLYKFRTAFLYRKRELYQKWNSFLENMLPNVVRTQLFDKVKHVK